MEIFVYCPQKFENLCVFARTLEVLGFKRCHVYDPKQLVLRDYYGKGTMRRLRTVSAGAFFKIDWIRIEDPIQFVQEYQGRRIATVSDQGAEPLYEVSFRPNDLLLLGSEAQGLPVELEELCDLKMTIPQQGVTESLNVAVAASIIVAESRRQEWKSQSGI